MGFGGHVIDMIKRSKQTHDLILERREKRMKLQELKENSKIYAKLEFHDKEVSPEELLKIKKEIKRKITLGRLKGIILSVLITIIIITAFLLLIYDSL